MAAKIQNSPLSRALMMFFVLTGCTIAVLQLRRLPLPSLPQIEFPTLIKLPNLTVAPRPTPTIAPNAVSDRKLVVD
ncbi:MAG TPA: hypothetical protein VL134_09365, partial [Leptolyngbya sp.]|nr:hypothetical protein [Leptolyngbya sp.]